MGSACKFLVIDDNEIDRLITSRLLTSGGMTDVHTVNGGLEGIDWIKKHVNNIGQKLVVLVDIMMPGMDGFQFMEAFDTLDTSIKQVVQVFMLSSTLDPRDIKRAASNKTVKELLSKPLPVAKLSAAVQDLEVVRT
ncbi:response regulator [Chryseolinea sp. T2]|uniref:response regulator n=1 Tax=Chryseolinea sp. T2 TaxID=3129255 RepID=UPI0030778A78